MFGNNNSFYVDKDWKRFESLSLSKHIQKKFFGTQDVTNEYNERRNNNFGFDVGGMPIGDERDVDTGYDKRGAPHDADGKSATYRPILEGIGMHRGAQNGTFDRLPRRSDVSDNQAPKRNGHGGDEPVFAALDGKSNGKPGSDGAGSSDKAARAKYFFSKDNYHDVTSLKLGHTYENNQNRIYSVGDALEGLGKINDSHRFNAITKEDRDSVLKSIDKHVSVLEVARSNAKKGRKDLRFAPDMLNQYASAENFLDKTIAEAARLRQRVEARPLA